MLTYFLSELESPVKKLKTLMVSMPRLAMLGLDCVLVSTAEGGGVPEGVPRRGGAGRSAVSVCCGLVAGLVTSTIVITAAATAAVRLAG